MAFCLAVCALLPPFTHAAPDGEGLATRAQGVLKTHCARCHGPNGKAKGGFDFVLDRARLVARGKVVPGAAGESELFQRMQNRSMPPYGAPDGRPSEAAIELVQQWIDAGAPAEAETTSTFLSENDVAQIIEDDLQALEPSERRFARYFTLTHLQNAGLDGEALAATRQALSKLLNSLSWHPRVTRPAAIDSARTVYRIDLRAYKWTARLWDRLTSVYPYRVPDLTSRSRTQVSTTGSELTFVRADWFVATASRPPLYHDLLQLPERDRALERLLGVEVLEDIQQASVVRAGFNGSGVSRNNRVLERHDAPYGAYWRTYDFSDNIDRQNIFEHPLGPVPGPNAFVPAGGEILFHLPSGFQGYLLVDGEGRRVDKASNTIVSDPQRPDRQVENGISCMTCHVRGVLPKSDQVRAHMAKNLSAFSHEEAALVRALYPSDAKLRGLLKEDSERFVQALAKAGVVAEEPEPIAAVTLRYEGTLDLPTAAAELGLTAEDFIAHLRQSPSLMRSLGPLSVKGGTVQRSVFLAAFDEAVRALKPAESAKATLPPDGDPLPFTGHTEAVLCLAFAPDGRRAVSGSQDKTLRLWDVASGKELRRFEGHTDAVTCVAFMPDSRLLSGSRDHSVRLWDVETGTEVARFKGHTEPVRCVACSSDGQWILSGGADGTVRGWELKTGKELAALPRQEGGVYCLAFSPDGKQAVTGGSNGRLCLWNVDKGEPVQRFQGHTREVYCVALSADGQQLLTGGNDRTVRLWDLATGREVCCCMRQESAVLAVAFTADGDLLSGNSLYRGNASPLRLFDRKSGQERRAFPAGAGEQVGCVAFTADGSLALTAGLDHRLRLWKLGP
jgi:mono/diheme cytochrome c family protein